MQREARVRKLLGGADLTAGALALLTVGLVYPSAPALTPGNLLMLPVLLLLSRALGLYHKDEIRLGQKSLDEVPGLFQLATLFALGVWFMRHLLVGGETTGAHMTALLFGFLAIAFCMRLMARRVAQRLLAPERCLVIGDADAAGRLERALRLSTHGSLVVASIPCQSAAAELDLFTELSAPANLSEVVRSEQVDRLILAPRHHSTGHMLTLLNAAKAIGLRVTLVPFLGEVVGAAAEVESIGGVTVLGLPRFDLSRSARMIKRGLDSSIAALGLLAAAPLLLVLAVLVKLDSPGPVLFRQIRMGRDGEPFQILKFRSMVDGADAQKADLRSSNEQVGLFKIAADPRITRVGSFLRKTALDELPQLWNVLVGDMSLVGPRPLVEEEDATVVGWFRHRLHLQPGMTGQWQVLGGSRIPLEDMIRIDYLYVVNWSLWGDIKLLLQTIPYVLGRQGM